MNVTNTKNQFKLLKVDFNITKSNEAGIEVNSRHTENKKYSKCISKRKQKKDKKKSNKQKNDEKKKTPRKRE